MGLSFQSISFRRPKERPWAQVRGQLMQLFFQHGIPVTNLHLEEERPTYGYCSDDYGRMILDKNLLSRLSAITGDYVVGASCVDSDFLLLVLLHNGQEIDSGSIGHNWFADELGEESPALSIDRWLPLLQNPDEQETLVSCLLGNGYILIEDAARELTRLTGLPIIDEDALFRRDDRFDEDF